jgi:hypothetical protein
MPSIITAMILEVAIFVLTLIKSIEHMKSGSRILEVLLRDGVVQCIPSSVDNLLTLPYRNILLRVSAIWQTWLEFLPLMINLRLVMLAHFGVILSYYVSTLASASGVRIQLIALFH